MVGTLFAYTFCFIKSTYHFEASGYNHGKLIELKQEVLNKSDTANNEVNEGDTLVFPVHFFDVVVEFKSVVRIVSTTSSSN